MIIEVGFVSIARYRLDNHSKQGETHIGVGESRSRLRSNPQLRCRVGKCVDQRSIRIGPLAEHLPQVCIVQARRVIQKVPDSDIRRSCPGIVK